MAKKPKQRNWRAIAFFSVMILLIGAFVYEAIFSPIPLSDYPTSALVITNRIYNPNGHEYGFSFAQAYLATSAREQTQGFMYVNSSGLGNMLFLFNNESSRCFWNKNTRLPLTIAWINESGYITMIGHLTPYNTTPVCSEGQTVLETTMFSYPQNLSAGDLVQWTT